MDTGSVARAAPSIFIADANVLIDYLNADIAALGLFSKHVGTVYVLGLLLRDEVNGLTQADCKKAGLKVVESTTEVLLAAGERADREPMLSLYDWLCVLEAKERNAECITSDRALLKTCKKEGVPARRGLSPLLELVTMGHLDAKEAMRLAKKMADKNPYLMKVLPEFERELAARTKTS